MLKKNIIEKIKDPELKRICKFNFKLIEKKELIYLPGWNFLLSSELKNFSKRNDYENIEGQIYNQLISIEYRTQQRIMYEQLDLFKPLLTLIDHATICFYQGNYICSYFSMIPLVEGLLRKWSEISADAKFEPNKVIKDIVERVELPLTISKDNDFVKDSIILNIWLLKAFINKIFKNDNDNLFNRHVVAHLLKDPDFFESRLNILKLFCLMDLIAICYQYEYPINDKTIEIKADGITKYIPEYEIINKDKKEIFKEFYKSCFNSKNQTVAIFELIKNLKS